ncbi:antibiotic biosynthesis monooxygenase [Streptomyces sp. NRRL S-813]|uniref:antibiotic biosynthesis monooxygenase n=1 Tax=Streptomyces sp. NRRL S-813 TaxID=1463919 RepID=UPI000691B62B|nr:antibiotic biosynthesis monooxygenase [Streptomyces sp. NRRL S-813]
MEEAVLTFTLDITVRTGHETEAIRTLTAVEAKARTDAGCVQFTWFQHVHDPYRFTLVEQWESQEHLDAHLAADPALWETFVPALAGEPRSTPLRPVADLARTPDEETVRDFARTWFDRLSDRAPLEEMLAYVAADGLEMVFPEATLTDHQEFAAWYAEVGTLFRDQKHDLERIEVTPAADGSAEGAVDVDVTVVWRATVVAEGRRSAARARQSWRLRPSFRTGAPEIVRYRVRSLEEIAV